MNENKFKRIGERKSKFSILIKIHGFFHVQTIGGVDVGGIGADGGVG